jgi:hypothetical protein
LVNKARRRAGALSIYEEEKAAAPDVTKPQLLASFIFPWEEILCSGLVSSPF